MKIHCFLHFSCRINRFWDICIFLNFFWNFLDDDPDVDDDPDLDYDPDLDDDPDLDENPDVDDDPDIDDDPDLKWPVFGIYDFSS